ncbi:flavin reductase family protein [Streptomyces sp. NPDC051546]|uniref:flavin reductase family protein n=1 Tax=Streptomyces sp. NPDC051546 TaxID=3365655 RepID=UPI0037B4A2CF
MSAHGPLAAVADKPPTAPGPAPSGAAPTGTGAAGPGSETPARRFRRTAGRFPTGVTVVTTLDQGRPHGTTVNSFTTVSMDPCLVLVALGRSSRLHDKILASSAFTVSVLSETQEDDARWFADPARPAGADAFTGRPWRPAPHSGAPILLDGVAYFDCAVEEARRAGDHTLLVGRVETFGVLSDGPALTFADSAFTPREDRP